MLGRIRTTAIPVLSILVLPLVSTPATGQEGLPGVFGEVLDVEVVNIEVVVTDRDGIRVRGLGPADFRLWVDGEETPIDYFTEIRGGEAVTPSEETGTATVPALEEGERVGTSYLVFIDEYFSIPRDRDPVLDRLREQIGFLQPEDRMAVVAFDGKGLEMLSTWSSESATLERVLLEAARRPARGLQRAAEVRALSDPRRRRSAGPVRPGGFLRLDPDERYAVSRLQEQVKRSVDAAAATLRAFANPPGRKVMLLLSGGWPYDPATFLVNDETRVLAPEDRSGGGEDLFRRLTDTANLLGYTVYPVDVPGLSQEFTDATIEAGVPPPSVGTLSLRENQVHYGLEFMAEATGGEAFLNSRRLEAVEEVVRDTTSYYWLGFTPERTGDDRRREIRVEVSNPRLRVRSRSDFHDFSRRAEVTMAVESSMLFGNPPSAATIPLRIGEPSRAGIGKVEVPVAVAIPLSEVTMVRVGDEWVSELELRIVVRDEDGDLGPIPVVPLVIRRDEPPEPGEHAGWSTRVKIRKAPHELLVAVFDPVTGKLLAARDRVEP